MNVEEDSMWMAKRLKWDLSDYCREDDWDTPKEAVVGAVQDLDLGLSLFRRLTMEDGNDSFTLSILSVNHQTFAEGSQVLIPCNRLVFDVAPRIILRFLNSVPSRMKSRVKNLALPDHSTYIDDEVQTGCGPFWGPLCREIGDHMRPSSITLEVLTDSTTFTESGRVFPSISKAYRWHEVSALRNLLLIGFVRELRIAYYRTHSQWTRREGGGFTALEHVSAHEHIRYLWEQDREIGELRDLLKANANILHTSEITELYYELLKDQMQRRQKSGLDIRVNPFPDCGNVLVVTRPIE